ncbi:MAG: sensor histidine kinase [Bacteroidia bacterium]
MSRKLYLPFNFIFISIGKALCFIILFSFPIKIFANHTPLSINYGKNKGLPNLNIYDIIIDKNGFVWLATEYGIYRFDGQNFKPYQSNEQNSLAGSSLKEDKFGRIWYENFDGFLFYVENDSLKTLPNQNPNAFYPIALDSERLFYHYKNKLKILSLKTLQEIKQLNIPNENIHDVDSRGNKIFMTDKNTIIIIDSSERVTKLILNTTPKDITARIHVSQNQIFTCSKFNENSTFYTFKNNIQFTHSISLKSGLINKLYVHNNTLYILSTNGIYTFIENGNKWIEKEHWFPELNILSIAIDKSGSIWLGTNGLGLLKIPDTQKHIINFPKEKSFKTIKSTSTGFIASGANGEVYYLDFNLNILKQIYQDPDSIPFISLEYDEPNQLLFTSSKYSHVIDLKTGKTIISNNFSQKDFTKIDQKYYLIGTSNSCLLIKSPVATKVKSIWDDFFNLNNKNNSEFIDILKYARVKSVQSINNGSVLMMATNRGLFFKSLKNEGEILFKEKKLFLQKLIVINNEIWGLSQRGELFLIKQIQNSTEFVIQKLERKETIFSIKASKNGIILLEEFGCTILNTTTLNPIGEVKLNSFNIQLLDAEYINNNLFLLSNNGWLKKNLNTKDPIRNSWFNIYAINNGTNLIKQTEPFQLDWNKNTLDIKFLWFPGTGDEANSIEYNINNGAWIRLENETRELHLEALNPGDYQIVFKTGNHEWLDKKVIFKINKPIWLQYWFILLIASSALLFMYWYYANRLKSMQERNQLVTQRLTLEKELNHSRLSSIRAQMNPHFFYNALNTIQAYIFQKDPENAIDYLNKFARLTRIILDGSDKETVSLENELESLQMYLELEKMRFSEQFDFKIKCLVKDLELIKIPSMIVQPYVENAIKHGLMHIIQNRMLNIEFSEQNEYLQVIVDDNGIGRKKAGELNKIKESKHQSFSTSATEKRLNILNRGLIKKVLVEYVDKKTETGMSLGTRVIIRIPLL